MHRLVVGAILLTAAAALFSCVPTSGTGVERNAFFSFTDEFGTALLRDPNREDEGTGADREVPEEEFRRPATVTFANLNAGAELAFAFIAWVDPSSIRSRAQEDALYRGGYVQLREPVQLGSAFRLATGTFVFNGPGLAGATPVVLRRATAGGAQDPNAGQGQDQGDPNQGTQTGRATEMTLSLVTPDVILVLAAPPFSCESLAFVFTNEGELEETPAGFPAIAPSYAHSPSTERLGLKTLAQVSAYQCSPFRPGLFLKRGGGGRLANEFFEGDLIRFEFSPLPVNGYFAVVTIEEP